MRDWRASTALASLGTLLVAIPAFAEDINPNDLVNLSLEQLSNIEVTSVSKRSEKESEAAAAIYVITQDDIRRSGMTSIPELLRMVPGLDVAQAGSHEWAITSRGFNSQFANKLLVLIDGRTVYTPSFSGVYWDVQDTPLQDIERIEVIRGPGATLWGANAVNGVINIITKSAKDTQGALASATVGTLDKNSDTVRYGTKTSDDGYIRMYAKYDDYAEDKTAADVGAHDPWIKQQSGFRSDWKSGDSQSFTLQGDAYHAGETGQVILPATPLTLIGETDTATGANILGRWDNKISKDSDVTFQMYYDDAQRSNIIYNDNIQTLDIDLQHVWTALEGHEIVWGGGYRMVNAQTGGNNYIQFTPMSQTDNLFSTFVQDKITLHPDDVFLTLGSKLEHNSFTNFEYEPSARLSWLPDSTQTVWGSVSRAVHTPDIGLESVQSISQIVPMTTPPPYQFLALVGSPKTESEELVAYELGYRVQPVKTVSLDVSTYYNSYNRLILGEQGAPLTESSPLFGTPYYVVPIYPVNTGTAHSEGIETSAKWDVTSKINLAAGYTLEELKFDQPDPYGLSFDGKSPKNEFNVRATVLLPHNVEFNAAYYYVDSLAAKDLISQMGTPSYTRADFRLAWKPIDSLEVSLVGQNLFDQDHKEFSGFLYQESEQVPRSVLGNVTWKY